MPLYEFHCKNKKCQTELFEEICTYEQISLVHCPTCDSPKVVKKIGSKCSTHFKQPRDSSKWDNFEYRAGYLLDKAQDERRSAEALSHMGSTPLQDVEGIDLGKHDMETTEGKISDVEFNKAIL